jgi:hypothetical protein
MSAIKKFDIAGIASNVQLGKKGGYIKYNPLADNGAGSYQPAMQFMDNTASDLMRVQIGTPLAPQDAVTKLYVDSYVQGLDAKESVMVASTTGQNLPIMGTLSGTMLDSVQLITGWRVLLKDQTDSRENGIYRVTTNGANYTLVRTPDADNVDITNNPSAEVSGGMYVFVERGTINASTGWVLSSPQGTAILGTDNLTFTQFSSAGVTQAGAGLNKVGVELQVEVDNTTVHVNGNNDIAIKSSTTVGQLLVSQGTGDATWGTVNLGSPNAVGVSTLLAINGGTGINTYTYGDVLVGGSTANTLTKLSKGANLQFLGVDSNGLINYNYIMTLRDSSGQAILTTTGVDNSTNNLVVGSSAGTNPVFISSTGTASNLDIMLSPKNNGLVIAKTGYDSFVTTNRATVTNEAFITKGYVDFRVDSIDTTKIQNPATTTYFATNQSGFSNKAIIASNNKVMAEFVGNTGSGIAESGERLQVTHVSNEVQLKSINSTGSGNVNMRFIPQAQGQVFIGSTGAGLIQGELGFALTIKGGDSETTNPGGHLYLYGGAGTQGNNSGGSVYIKAGSKDGTGIPGTTIVQDHNTNKLVEFTSPTTGVAGNWLEISNALLDNDSLINSVKVKVADASGAGDCGIVFGVKGSGLLKVNSGSTYLSSLQATGNTDALVTKAYVNSRISDTSITAGNGLTNVSNVFNVNVGATTVKLDSLYNLIVNSSVTANQVMLSSGISGQEAVWGAIPLGNSNAVTGTLSVPNGGTGYTTYQPNDILIGNTGNTLNKLAKGSNNTYLGVNATTGNLTYMYISNLRDTNGNLVASSTGISGAENWLVFKNAIVDSAPTITVGGTNTNLDLFIEPIGTGLLKTRTGYTADLLLEPSTTREAFATKGYVDDVLKSDTDGMVRRVRISDYYTSAVNVGEPTPDYFDRDIYITRVVLHVETPISGGLVTQARIKAGAIELMSFDENDIQEVGTYVAELPMNNTSNNTQIIVEFYRADGLTLGTPTGGDITVSAEYKVD